MRAPELLVLGSGSALPQPGRAPSGYAIETARGETTLLDAGPGTLARYGDHGGTLERIRRVVLTHFHPDHCLDLATILFARRNPDLKALPALELIAPRGLRELLAGLERTWGAWVRAEGVKLVELPGEGGGLETEEFELRALPTHHTPNSLCYALRFAGGESLCYSGDSDLVEELVENARGAELLLCECSFPDESGCAGHMTPSRVGELARRTGVGRAMLTHFYPACDPEAARRAVQDVFPGEVLVAYDGLRTDLRGLTSTS